MKNYIRYLASMIRKSKAPVAAIAIAAVLLVLPIRIEAQSSSAVLSGHVIDKSQGAVSDATVRLVEETMKFAYTTHTNASGDFSFTYVQPGTYSVIVAAPGYKEFHKVHVVLYAQQSISTGTVMLDVGAEAQSVTVQADLTPLQRTTSDRADVVDTEQVDDLLMIGRDPMALMRTLPGIKGGNGNSSAAASATDVPMVNGILSDYVMASIDGVLSNLKGTTMDTPINADSVKEITVQQSNYRAEYGSSAGAQINFVTKNGTQNFHGGLYEYFRNEDLNANTWSHKYNGNVARSRYRYNTVGGTVSGPVYWPGRFNANKNKLFFFVNYEDSPVNTPNGLSKFMIPTLAEIGGDFSSTYNSGISAKNSTTLIHIKKPSAAQGTCNKLNPTDTSGCYSGNIIPSSQINSNAQAALKMIYNWTLGAHPERAYTDISVTQNSYNYVVDNNTDSTNHQEVFRIDYSPNDRLHTFFRYENAVEHSNTRQGNWGMMLDAVTTVPNYAANITYTFTPNLVNEFNTGMAAQRGKNAYSNSDLNSWLTTTNSISLPALFSGTNPMNLLPAMSFGIGPSISWDSKFPFDNVARSTPFTDNLTWVHGDHAFKVGATYIKMVTTQPVHNQVPNFSFSSTTSNASDTNFGWSNALAGELNNFSEYKRLAGIENATLVEEWYYQDTWKAAKNLTIDIGLRNSYIPAQVVKNGTNWLPSLYDSSKAPSLYQYGVNASGSSVAVDPTTGLTYPAAYRGLFVPNSGTVDNGALYMNTAGYPKNGTYGNGLKWAPRAGFAWEFLPNTVLRGSYGIFYHARTRLTEAGSFETNGPWNMSVTQYYSSINSSDSDYYVNAGTLEGPYAVNHAIPLHSPTPYSQNFTLGIQRQLHSGILLDVAYVGTLMRHDQLLKNINRVPYGAEYKYSHQFNGTTLPDNYYRPYPGLGNIYIQENGYTSNYNSLQVRATRRYRNGMEFGLSYTFSKLLAYSYYNGEHTMTYLNPRVFLYGPSMLNVKHNLVVNYLYSIPKASKAFGEKSAFNNPALRAIFDNWQISGLAWLQGPAPYNNVYEDFNSGQNVAGGGDGDDIMEVCDPWSKKIPHVTRTYKTWFNTSCFVPSKAGTIGTAANPDGTQWSYLTSTNVGKPAPFAPVYLPDDINFQTALFKNIPLRNNMKLQLRVETYNTFNHTRWNSVNGDAKYANANSQDTSVNPQLNTQFGQLNGANDNRYVQLVGRINF